MKNFVLLFFAFFLFHGICVAQKKRIYKVYKNPHRLIETLEFNSKGFDLRLSDEGIRYCKRDLKGSPHVIGAVVERLYSRIEESKFLDLNVTCIGNQIYWHTCAYDFSKSESETSGNKIMLNQCFNKNLNVVLAPGERSKLVKKFTNKRLRGINVIYEEVIIDNACNKNSQWSVPPNIIEGMYKYIRKDGKWNKRKLLDKLGLKKLRKG